MTTLYENLTLITMLMISAGPTTHIDAVGTTIFSIISASVVAVIVTHSVSSTFFAPSQWAVGG